MGRIDLDAARAAQAEAEGEEHELVFGGEVFELPSRLPLAFAISLQEGEFKAALEALLGIEAVPRFLALGPSLDDVMLLVEHATSLYGLDTLGESLASGGSSPNGGESSRRISPGSTGSTSPRKRSGRST